MRFEINPSHLVLKKGTLIARTNLELQKTFFFLVLEDTVLRPGKYYVNCLDIGKERIREVFIDMDANENPIGWDYKFLPPRG